MPAVWIITHKDRERPRAKDPYPPAERARAHTHTHKHTSPDHSFLSRVCSISPYPPSPALRDRSSRSYLQRRKWGMVFTWVLIVALLFPYSLFISLHLLFRCSSPVPPTATCPGRTKMCKNASVSLQHDLFCVLTLTPGPLNIQGRLLKIIII